MLRVVRLSLIFVALSAQSVMAQEWQAQLRWSQPLDMGLTVNGVVAKVHVSVGDRVPKDKRLLSLDQRPFDAAVRAANATLKAAEPVRAEAELELERTLELYDRGSISQHEKRLAEIALISSTSAVDTAKADLTSVRVHREYSRLSAPYAAIVREVLTAPGQSVVSSLRSEPLLRIARADEMLAVANLRPDQIVQRQSGEKVVVSVADQSFDAQVISVGVEPKDAGAGPEYELVVHFNPGTSILRPGQRAKITTPP